MTENRGLLQRSVQAWHEDVVAAAEAAIPAAGASVIFRIDHAAAAADVGLHLRPTTLLLFGNPAGGTHLMQALPDSAIDLPMKLLIIADGDRAVRVLGEDPAWIARRHGGGTDLDEVVAVMRRVMNQVLDQTERSVNLE